MTKATRYRIGVTGERIAYEHGDYVSFEDHKALEEELYASRLQRDQAEDKLAQATKELAALRGKAGELVEADRACADDTERLEWLVAMRGKMQVIGNDDRGWSVCDTSNGLTFASRGHKSYRGAIDAARQENDDGK